jgi:hypothetical protein
LGRIHGTGFFETCRASLTALVILLGKGFMKIFLSGLLFAFLFYVARLLTILVADSAVDLFLTFFSLLADLFFAFLPLYASLFGDGFLTSLFVDLLFTFLSSETSLDDSYGDFCG